MRSASATSSFSSPLRSRPKTRATFSPAATRGAISAAASAAPTTGFAWSCARAVAAKTNVQSAIAAGEAVVKLGGVENAVGAGRHHPRLRVRPGLDRRDEAQPRQAEIGHGARRRADILAELRLDQDDDRSALLRPAFGLVGSGAWHGYGRGSNVAAIIALCKRRPQWRRTRGRLRSGQRRGASALPLRRCSLDAAARARGGGCRSIPLSRLRPRCYRLAA